METKVQTQEQTSLNEAQKDQKHQKSKRNIPAQEKCRAVLSVWTESRSISEICRELSATRSQVKRWQEIAMEAILKSLDQTPRKVRKTVLSKRLETLLTNRKVKQPPQATPSLPQAVNQDN